jgi:hypothetical protein
MVVDDELAFATLGEENLAVEEPRLVASTR